MDILKRTLPTFLVHHCSWLLVSISPTKPINILIKQTPSKQRTNPTLEVCTPASFGVQEGKEPSGALIWLVWEECDVLNPHVGTRDSSAGTCLWCLGVGCCVLLSLKLGQELLAPGLSWNPQSWRLSGLVSKLNSLPDTQSLQGSSWWSEDLIGTCVCVCMCGHFDCHPGFSFSP